MPAVLAPQSSDYSLFIERQLAEPHGQYGQQSVFDSDRALSNYTNTLNTSPFSKAGRFSFEHYKQSFVTTEAHILFSDALTSALEAEPVEDSYSHPAEKIMGAALKLYGLSAQRWIAIIYDKEEATRPWFVTDLLRIVGRMELNLITPWGFLLAGKGLVHKDESVRDAAVRALELWGGVEAKRILQAYVEAEQVGWLAEFTRQVINELAG